MDDFVHGPFASFIRQGIWHIWSGTDHLLFLTALLLPAVLLRTPHGWQPAPRFGGALIAVVKTVTAFTAAHSLTLGLGALGYVVVPPRLVESAIAASVLVAALNNIRPLIPARGATGRVWPVAFAFGLVHGLGFAGALTDLGLPRETLLPALVGFNLGVEAGQLVIVAAVVPVAYGLRGTPFYRRGVVGIGSLAIMALAGVWLIERVLDVTLI